MQRSASWFEKKKEYKLDKINFEDELDKYRKRTSCTKIFTLQQTEDVMFIDNTRVVSLEYIFYPKTLDAKGKSDYQVAREHKPETIDDGDHKLGAEDYFKNIDKDTK